MSNIYLPTFSESNARVQLMTGDCRYLSTSEATQKTTILASFDFVRSQKNDTKSSFKAFLDWIFLFYHVLKMREIDVF